MNEVIKMYEEELNILENLMYLAQEDGRGDRYRKYYKEYTEVRERMEEERYLNAYA